MRTKRSPQNWSQQSWQQPDWSLTFESQQNRYPQVQTPQYDNRQILWYQQNLFNEIERSKLHNNNPGSTKTTGSAFAIGFEEAKPEEFPHMVRIPSILNKNLINNCK